MAEKERVHPDVISQRELDSTQVSPRVARVLVLSFVAILAALPLAQMGLELARGERIQAFDVFRPIGDAGRALPRKGVREAWTELKPLFSQKFLRDFEEDLGKSSAAKSFFQPRVQGVMTGALGFGNDKCVVGRDGWLFYQPGVDYLTGPGLLDEAHLVLRAKKMVDKLGVAEPHPDPRPAILQFQRDCQAAGAHLLIVPLPDKAMLQPAQLTRRMVFSAPLPVPNNHDFAAFVAQLREQGVDVFDPAPAELKPDEPPRFLEQDTHWTPAYMEQVASALAEHVRRTAPLPPPAAPFAVRTEERQVANLGDLVGMLKLASDQQLFRPQTVTIRRVLDAQTGAPWQPDAKADVLLLGDSYTNVYTDGEEGLKWGDAAGFGPQLSRFLGRPLDVIAKNGSGASLTRGELARRPDPLGGKRLVIWSFAIRDLTHNEVQWEVIPLQAKAKVAVGPTSAAGLVVLAELVTQPAVKNPAGSPYVNALITLKFTVRKVESGKLEAQEILATLPAILNRALQPVARFQPGRVYRLTLENEQPKHTTTWTVFGETGNTQLESFWAAKADEAE